MSKKRGILRPLPRYTATDDPIDTKTFCVRAYGLQLSEVTWHHRDFVTYWLRREYPKADTSDRSIWYLTPEMRIRAHRYLLVASSVQA